MPLYTLCNKSNESKKERPDDIQFQPTFGLYFCRMSYYSFIIVRRVFRVQRHLSYSVYGIRVGRHTVSSLWLKYRTGSSVGIYTQSIKVVYTGTRIANKRIYVCRRNNMYTRGDDYWLMKFPRVAYVSDVCSHTDDNVVRGIFLFLFLTRTRLFSDSIQTFLTDLTAYAPAYYTYHVYFVPTAVSPRSMISVV